MEVKKFTGLNNTTSPERFPSGALAVALDVDIDNTKRLMSRRGKTLINATPCHSLYASEVGAFVMQGSSLYAIEANLSLTLVKVLSSANELSYETLGGIVYFTNGVECGRIIGRTYSRWGITPPVYQPTASATTGNLRAGRYQFAMTFLRNDGNESGTGLSGTIDVADGAGIRMGNLEVSTNPDVSSKVLYLSSRDGEVLYRAMTVPNSQITAFVSDEPTSGIPLMTQFAVPPPPSSFMHVYNGVMYMVKGDTVYYSDTYNFELYRLHDNFMRFPGTVSLFAGVNDGVYVATSDSEGDGTEDTQGSTWFLTGGRPDQFKSQFIFNYGSTPGTSVFINSEFFGEQVERLGEPVLVWAGRHGVCVGGDGGQAHNLTESVYSLPSAQDGAALVRQYRGFVQYLVTQRGTGAANNAYVENI